MKDLTQAHYYCHCASRDTVENTLIFFCFSFILGYVFPAVFFIAASYSSNSSIVRALIALGMGLNGLSICGYYVNHLDIAPPLAGVLLGVTDTAATVAGIVSPTLTGVIVQHHVSTAN